MAAYSFVNCQASITGPGGSFSLGSGNGNADEGIVITTNEKTVLTIGADGTGMYSLLADKSGKVELTLLKTSPVNAKLMGLFDAQAVSSSVWGQNIITIVDTGSGDSTACRQCAFSKKPDLRYAKEGGTVTWEFLTVAVDSVLGVY
jgi:hypothetical protein